jgi:hypothetical protein
MKNRGSVVWLSKGRIVDEEDLSVTAKLLELGALDSVDYFANGELKCVVATEDSGKEPLRALLWSNGFVEEDTEVTSYSGCTKVDAALVLGRFLQEKAPHVRLVIHRDRDYQQAAATTAFTDALNGVGVVSLITQGNDIESYFLNPEHLHSLNPGVEVVRIQELITQATTETENKSVEAIVNQRTAEAFRNRQGGGGQINHGEIATSALADYRANTASLRRGKVVLGRLLALLQQELGANPRIFFPSEHLRSAELEALAERIWPEEA